MGLSEEKDQKEGDQSATKAIGFTAIDDMA